MRQLLLCSLLATSLSAEGASLWVSSPARLYERHNITRVAIEECAPQQALAQAVIEEMAALTPDVQPWASTTALDDKDRTPRLILTILSGNTGGGGSWTGSKMLMIRAELERPGAATLSMVKSRAGKGGMFGAVKGTCGILQSVADSLAEDVAAWLKKQGNLTPSAEETASASR